jgi:predicted RNase H-like HicB family nuclease
MRICIPLNSKTDSVRKWVAKVSYKNRLAFYAVGSTFDETLANIKEKADTHFANLASLRGLQVELKRIGLAEIDINEAFVIDFLVKSSTECRIGVNIPPELLLPLQMSLCPVVDMYDEDPWLSECRGMIAKEEACYLANKGIIGPYSVAKLKEDDNGELVWDVSSRTGEKEHLSVKGFIS